MRTASPCLLAFLLAACNSNTSSSQGGPGTPSADAAVPADAAQADRAPETDGQTGNGSTTVTATGTHTTLGTGTSTGAASSTGTGTATPLATGTGTGTGSGTGTSTSSSTASGRWQPGSAGTINWDWQIGASADAAIIPPTGSQMIDVDGFNVSAAKVAALHAAGLKVVCYLDVGSYETGRPDSADYPAALRLSEDPDWPGEWFLDTRDVFKSGSVLAGILNQRFQMCETKASTPSSRTTWTTGTRTAAS